MSSQVKKVEANRLYEGIMCGGRLGVITSKEGRGK